MFKSGNKFGIMDFDGNQIIPPEFPILQTYGDDLLIASKDGKMGVLNMNGDWIIDPKVTKIDRDRDLFRVGFGLFGTYRGFMTLDGQPVTFTWNEFAKAEKPGAPRNTPVTIG